jgi:hypothetical protein
MMVEWLQRILHHREQQAPYKSPITQHGGYAPEYSKKPAGGYHTQDRDRSA